MILRPYQHELSVGIDAEWARGAMNVCAVAPTGAGKCLGKGTPVLMYDGRAKPVEAVVEGDLLMGPDSLPRRVLSTCAGSEDMYRVTPVKGDCYVVNKSHILSLKRTGANAAPVNLSVREYLGKSKTFKHIHKGWRSGIDWPGSPGDRFLPPYMLGLWLGDGASRHAAITTPDMEVVLYIYRFAEENGLNVRYEPQTDNKSSNYHITSGWRRKDTMLASLKMNDLILNKHIPHKYKTASRADRLELLAGIVDSDGSLSNGGYDVVLKQKRLAEDVVFVARSLGFAAYVKKCRKTCCNTGAVGTYYRFNISGDTHKIPVKIHRKKAAVRRQKKNVLYTGIKVEGIGVGDYYGFEITGDGLFLLGDFTVTHNTVLFGNKLAAERGVTFAIAHRQELVSQMSMALAKFGVVHSIQAPTPVIKWIVSLHMRAFSRHYYDPQALCILGGVRTIANRADSLSNAINQARLWVVDECQHLLKDNEWGKVVDIFPESCRGLGVTATPLRADGNGLGRHADGVFDSMVMGPNMRDLINAGYLTDYRIFAPPSTLDLSTVPVGSGGDFVKTKLIASVRKSTITGDVVEHYLKIAPGKIGVTFVPDIETGAAVAASFNAAGVPAAAIHAKTPLKERQQATMDLERGDLKNLVNVDIFGEGFDLPAIEVVSFARPTRSYGLYVQQFGRGLRIMDGKTYAIIIDHVGNVAWFAAIRGLPDSPQVWTLDRREKRSKTTADPDLVPVKTCLSCTAVYEGFHRECPYCGHVNTPGARGSVEMVEGDLLELDPAALAAMRGEVDRIDAPPESVGTRLRHAGAPDIAVAGAMARHRERQESQAELRAMVALWAGHQRAAGAPDYVSYKRFYKLFGTDVVSAQALGRGPATELTERIRSRI